MKKIREILMVSNLPNINLKIYLYSVQAILVKTKNVEVIHT